MNPSRVSLLAAIALIPLAGIATRLAQLQLVSRDDYISHLLKRKRSVELTRAPRGSIFDRHGEVLAEDQRAFDCYLVLEEYEENPGPLGTLLGLAPGEFRKRTDKMYARIERQAQRRPPRERRAIYRRERRTPYLLERDIDFEAALAIETNPTLYPGAVVRESLKRCYPRGTAGAHIIGYLGRVTANEQEFRRLLDEGYFTEGFEEHIGEDGIARLYRRGAFHEELLGRAGIEQRYNDDLRGRHGLLIFEREPGTSRKTLIELLPIRRGTDLRLTLDIRLQEEVERIVAEKEQAAAVVLDPSTGAVLALGSSRGFDPNDFTPPRERRRGPCGARRQRRKAHDEPRVPVRLPARIDLQGGDRRRGVLRGNDDARGDGALQREVHPGIQSLQMHGHARGHRPARGAGPIVQLLLL